MTTPPAPSPVSTLRSTGPRILVAREVGTLQMPALALPEVIPGATVQHAVGTAACLAGAADDRCDAVLLEANFCLADRFELVKRLDDKAVVTVVHDADEAIEMFAAGARGIIAVGDDVSILAEAVRRAIDGRSYVPSQLLSDMSLQVIHRRHSMPRDQRWLAVLSNREREILDLLVGGLCQADIAARLSISPFTAKTHIRHLLIKLGVRTVAEARAQAAQANLSVAEFKR